MIAQRTAKEERIALREARILIILNRRGSAPASDFSISGTPKDKGDTMDALLNLSKLGEIKYNQVKTEWFKNV